MEVLYAQVNRLAEVVILVYKLGLAQLAQSIEKNVMDLKYLITIGPLQQLTEFMATIGLAFCSVSHGVYMIKVLAASTTILGMVWGVVESEQDRIESTVLGQKVAQ